MLADYLDGHYAPGSCNLVFSALAKKDISGIIQPLKQCIAIGQVFFTCIHGEDQLQELTELWKQGREEADNLISDQDVRCIASPKEALKAAVHQPDTKLTVCAGSLYLVGEIEAILDEE